MDIAIAVPLASGASGGTLRSLTETIRRWRVSNRVAEMRIHAPVGLLPDLDALGVEVRRYKVSRLGLSLGQFEPRLSPTKRGVVFVPTARPIKVGGIAVLTAVRNVEPIQAGRYRASVSWRIRRRALRWQTLKACQQATRVVVVSHYVKERLVCCGIPECRVDVVYHGASSISEGASEPQVCAGVRRPFVFTAGSIVPYRGFEDTIRALAVVKEAGEGPLTLVIAGSGGLDSRYERWLRSLPRALGVEEDTVWAGQLSAREMNWCIANALAVVQTSRAESFSMFQVEALQAGAWIISCTQRPMPEILGTAAGYYATDDPHDLARLLVERVEASEDEVLKRQVAARSRGAFFSWDREAAETLDALEAARDSFAVSRK